MRNYFTFGDIDSRTFECYISGSGVFNAPPPKYTEIEVPGRSGHLLIEHNTFDNIEVTYPAFISSDFINNVSGLRNALLSKKGYQPLKDSYHPSETRYGCYMDGFSIKPSKSLREGEFDISFNCKPQRFLDSGMETITLTESGTVDNPTPFACYPLIKVTGYGTLNISSGNTISITIEDIFPDVTIDCETYACLYDGMDNANDAVQIDHSGEFPTFRSGTTTITIPNTVTQVDITPRWFIL